MGLKTGLKSCTRRKALRVFSSHPTKSGIGLGAFSGVLLSKFTKKPPHSLPYCPASFNYNKSISLAAAIQGVINAWPASQLKPSQAIGLACCISKCLTKSRICYILIFLYGSQAVAAVLRRPSWPSGTSTGLWKQLYTKNLTLASNFLMFSKGFGLSNPGSASQLSLRGLWQPAPCPGRWNVSDESTCIVWSWTNFPSVVGHPVVV